MAGRRNLTANSGHDRSRYPPDNDLTSTQGSGAKGKQASLVVPIGKTSGQATNRG